MSDTFNNELWAAVCLPSVERDVDRFDFESFDAAEEYVFNRMCKHCKEERMAESKRQAEEEMNL